MPAVAKAARVWYNGSAGKYRKGGKRMNNQEACELLERLIAGVHPTTGELLAND